MMKNSWPARVDWRRSVFPLGVFGAFTLPLPIAWGSIALPLLLLAALVRGDWGRQLRRIVSVPAAVIAFGLVLLYALGMAYSSGGASEVTTMFTKYARLLSIPLLVGAFDDARWRLRAIDAFLAAAALAMALSYARFVGLVRGFADPNQLYTAFQDHITFGIMLSVAVFVAARRALFGHSGRWLWSAYALLGTVCVLMLNSGRTGWLVLFVLLLLLFVQRWNIRGVAVGMLACAVVAGVAMLSPITRHKVEQVVHEVRGFERGHDDTAVGLRLAFYTNSLALIEEHPLIGSGTGSFKVRYAQAYAADKNNILTSNPHDEYILTTVQLGVVGLLVVLALGGATWMAARRIPGEEGALLRALVIAAVIGSTFNSMLLDAGSGRFLAVLVGMLLAARADALERDARA